MNGYSEDLRRRIVSTAEHDVQEPSGAPFRQPSAPLRLHRDCDGALGELLHHVPCHSPDRRHKEKGGRSAAERGEFKRAAWRVMVAAAVEPEALVFVDNLRAYRPTKIGELIEQKGCELLYLPAYSLNYNLIEEAFAKIKNWLRKAAAGAKRLW